MKNYKTVYFIPVFDRNKKLKGYYHANNGVIWMPKATLPKEIEHYEYQLKGFTFSEIISALNTLSPTTIVEIKVNTAPPLIGVIADSKRLFGKKILTIVSLNYSAHGPANSLIHVQRSESHHVRTLRTIELHLGEVNENP
jgi:hypothetical protein